MDCLHRGHFDTLDLILSYEELWMLHWDRYRQTMSIEM